MGSWQKGKVADQNGRGIVVYMRGPFFIGGLLLIATALVGTLLWYNTYSPDLGPESSQESTETLQSTRTIVAQDIPGAHANYQFTSIIPRTWEAEAISATEALNFYDPSLPGNSNLDTSQIFVRYFKANDFLTLSTVTIHAKQNQTYGSRAAVRYDIEKKADVATFLNQPSWRSERHIVTDIRVSETNPSIFYVIAKRPDLDESVYQQFLNQLVRNTSSQSVSTLIAPTAEFTQRITKKPFGIYITPATSPVQPERFSGYHTGVDVEYGDTTSDVPVLAMAEGTVVVSRLTSGYGGMVAIRHTLANKDVVAIYGHLDPASLPAVGASLKAGQGIGILGDDKSAETDGERKHLHFAIHNGSEADIRGYVSSKSELSGWTNPLDVLN